MISLPKQPIRRRKIYQEVADRIERMMLSGELKPGDAMPSERELMESFQVGRPSVREALFALQKMGLITVRNGDRAVVTRPSAERIVSELSGAVRHMLAEETGMQAFQQARLMVECAIVRYAAVRVDKDDLALMKAALEANFAAIGNISAFSRTDLDFHYAIIKVTRNPIFIALHSASFEWLTDQRMMSLRRKGADLAAYKGHRAVYEAIAKGDGDAAETAMARHLEQVARYYWTSRQDTGDGA